jgi:hypothetical protein
MAKGRDRFAEVGTARCLVTMIEQTKWMSRRQTHRQVEVWLRHGQGREWINGNQSNRTIQTGK